MAKDYYLILGVPSDATPDEIKSAYRREAKRCHPDHSGEGSEPFLDLREAYEVLGDAGRRQAYDDELAREKRRVHFGAGEVRPEPLRPRRCPVEPLVPTQHTSRPYDAFLDPSFPSFIAEFFRRPWSDLDIPIRPETRRRPEEIHVEVSLTQEQALHGGRVRIWVPVQIRCPTCRGRGGAGFFECLHCYGSGSIAGERPIDVEFPGGLVDGFRGSVPIRRPGIGDLFLVLHFRVTKR